MENEKIKNKNKCRRKKIDIFAKPEPRKVDGYRDNGNHVLILYKNEVVGYIFLFELMEFYFIHSPDFRYIEDGDYYQE